MGGRSMDVDWQADRDRWLALFVALRHETRAGMCALPMSRLVQETARSFSRWRRAPATVGYD